MITCLTVTAIGRVIILKRNKWLLSEFGGKVTLTKQWAQSIWHRMKYVKRRGSTKVHVPNNVFDELNAGFLWEIKVMVAMEDIPSSLIINWDQTGISFVPGVSWNIKSTYGI